jgi:hypothetical protein
VIFYDIEINQEKRNISMIFFMTQTLTKTNEHYVTDNHGYIPFVLVNVYVTDNHGYVLFVLVNMPM